MFEVKLVSWDLLETVHMTHFKIGLCNEKRFFFWCSNKLKLQNVVKGFENCGDASKRTKPPLSVCVMIFLVEPRWSAEQLHANLPMLRTWLCAWARWPAERSDRWQVRLVRGFRDNAATCRWNLRTAHLFVTMPRDPRIHGSLLFTNTPLRLVLNRLEPAQGRGPIRDQV